VCINKLSIKKYNTLDHRTYHWVIGLVATRCDNKHVKGITYRANVGSDMAKGTEYMSKCGNEVCEREQRTLFRHKSRRLLSTKNRVTDSRARHGYFIWLCRK
jgi:hypothetical protein